MAPLTRITAPLGGLVRIWGFVAAIVVLWAIPADAITRAPTLCLFKRFAGIECYGCGMTRAFHELVHGDLVAALHHNMLVVPIAVAIVLLTTVDVVQLVRGSGRAANGTPRASEDTDETYS